MTTISQIRLFAGESRALCSDLLARLRTEHIPGELGHQVHRLINVGHQMADILDAIDAELTKAAKAKEDRP